MIFWIEAKKDNKILAKYRIIKVKSLRGAKMLATRLFPQAKIKIFQPVGDDYPAHLKLICNYISKSTRPPFQSKNWIAYF